ncbi:tryptophan 2,3-dioxygenase family protein [Deinococcus yavapaiensis]|uniref:Tryptophan 2,3-dioxygenase n=1 Tax=Deinococcus yavapaiensis KR-236 TaxID=694435 RepID=A0A318S8Q3_9DEIO|nr:tryptophan 2,3-dioxygenase family protein [Deinococcus yavapaiensis]PYE54495.1 tryptophan 2,3-dioxygenase [Deinococcus yavapaiensis KR-236]
MTPRKPTLYWEYIKVEELLSLQSGLAESDADLSNDEVMFIVVHQVDELWFKLVLRELVGVRDLLARPHVPEQDLGKVVRSLRRVVVLFEQLSSHFALMETLTTRDYLAFRDKLSPASGFQSAGLREIELVLGLEEAERIPLGFEGSYRAALRHPNGDRSPALDRVEAREQDSVTLREALDAWLWRTPIQGSVPGQSGDTETVDAFLKQYLGAIERESRTFTDLSQRDAMTPEDVARLEGRHERGLASARAFLFAEDVSDEQSERAKRLRAALLFIESYRELPLLSWPREVIDAIVAMEQAMLIFRSRHARMVERVIGRRTGTGGSAGVDYLDQTALKYRVFKNLWAVRTLLLREEALPELGAAHFYDFHPDAKLTTQ